MKQGKLIALSAPSGTGKTTICKELLRKNKDWLFSVSVTTREKREGEIPDKDYIFITNEKFDHLIKFVPKEPPEPHTQEDHDYINTFPEKFKEVFAREQR